MSKIPEDIVKLQEQNSQIAINNLKDAYGLIEKLIQKTYMNNEMDSNSSLRNIRSDVSRIISEMGSKGLSSFNAKGGILADFYEMEDIFVDSSVAFLEQLEGFISQGPVDVFSLEGQLSRFEKSLKGRISVDANILNEFKAQQAELDAASNDMSGSEALSGETEIGHSRSFMGVASEKVLSPEEKSHPFGVAPRKHADRSVQKENFGSGMEKLSEDIGPETLSRIYNYFNLLEHKYSSHHPEISHDSSYIGDKRWNFEVSEKCITGTVKDGVFRTLLHFHTYWDPMEDVKEMMHFVQSRANAVPRDQFQSLCIVNSEWADEIKEWAMDFMHPRMMFFLYELNNEVLVFNETVEASGNLYVWHSPDRGIVPLEDKLQGFIEDNEYFDAHDISGETGLNFRGAEMFLQELVKRKKIVDVGFGTSRYTKSKT